MWGCIINFFWKNATVIYQLKMFKLIHCTVDLIFFCRYNVRFVALLSFLSSSFAVSRFDEAISDSWKNWAVIELVSCQSREGKRIYILARFICGAVDLLILSKLGKEKKKRCKKLRLWYIIKVKITVCGFKNLSLKLKWDFPRHDSMYPWYTLTSASLIFRFPLKYILYSCIPCTVCAMLFATASSRFTSLFFLIYFLSIQLDRSLMHWRNDKYDNI